MLSPCSYPSHSPETCMWFLNCPLESVWAGVFVCACAPADPCGPEQRDVSIDMDELFCQSCCLSRAKRIQHHVCCMWKREQFVRNVSHSCIIWVKKSTDQSIFFPQNPSDMSGLNSHSCLRVIVPARTMGKICMSLKQSALFIQSPWTSRIRKFQQWILMC